MKTTRALSAALLLAGTAYALPAHAQTAPQPPGAAPQSQSPIYGSASQSSQPYKPGETQPWAASQGRSGTMIPGQTQSYGATGAPPATQAPLPPGSFRTSCNDIRMAGDTLIAFCPKGDGTWQTSAIGPVNQCVGDIQNVNGQLTCNETGTGSSMPPTQAQPTPAQRRY